MSVTELEDNESTVQRFLLAKEAAAVLGVSPMTLYRMISERQFPAVRIRSRWIIPASAIGALTVTEVRPEGIFGRSLVDVPVVARVLRVSAATLYRLIHDGGFPAVRMRGRVLVPGHLVDEMAAEAINRRGAVDPSDWIDNGVNRANAAVSFTTRAGK